MGLLGPFYKTNKAPFVFPNGEKSKVRKTKEEVEEQTAAPKMTEQERKALMETLTAQMKEAAKLLEFEHAAYLRDKIAKLREAL